MLLKLQFIFARFAQFGFGLEQVYSISFTSASMLGRCYLTDKFPRLARNFLLWPLWGGNRRHYLWKCIQGFYPCPFPSVSAVSRYVFAHILETSLNPVSSLPLWHFSSLSQQLSQEQKQDTCFQCLYAFFWVCATMQYTFPTERL